MPTGVFKLMVKAFKMKRNKHTTVTHKLGRTDYLGRKIASVRNWEPADESRGENKPAELAPVTLVHERDPSASFPAVYF